MNLQYDLTDVLLTEDGSEGTKLIEEAENTNSDEKYESLT